MPAHVSMPEPPEQYNGCFVSLLVLDAAVKAKPASVQSMSDWMEAKLADFCRLASPQVTLLLL